MENLERQYWAKREAQERDSADRAEDEGARSAHREMADRYSAMVHDSDAADSTIPRRG